MNVRPTEPAPTRAERRSRFSATAVFFTLCMAGIVVAMLLTFLEATSDPAFEVAEVIEERRGTTSHVTARVTSNRDESRCPEVRIAARDRDTRDLAEVVATPVGSDGRIQPGQTLTYEATISTLSAQDYREELDEFRAYVFADHPCP